MCDDEGERDRATSGAYADRATDAAGQNPGRHERQQCRQDSAQDKRILKNLNREPLQIADNDARRTGKRCGIYSTGAPPSTTECRL